MLKKLLFIICFFVFTGFGQAQGEVDSKCSFTTQLYGIWVFEEMVFDLSGENLEEEGQAWEIMQEESSEMKGKLKLTIFPDGTVSGESTIDEPAEYAYGYWKTSGDCKQLLITMDDEENVFDIIAVDATKLVLQMEDYEEGGDAAEKDQPVKMVFLKAK